MLCCITCFVLEQNKTEHVMLYNVCHVMLYNIRHVMLYNICQDMLYNMRHVMLKGLFVL